MIQTKPGGTNFTGGGAVTFQYHGTSINPHAGNLATATVNSGTASVNVLAPPSAAYQPAAATGIDITNGHGCVRHRQRHAGRYLVRSFEVEVISSPYG